MVRHATHVILASRLGGVIEACPPSESVTAVTVDMLIEPDGKVDLLCCGDQIHAETSLRRWVVSVPQSSVDPKDLNSACFSIAEVCRAKGVVGFISNDFVTFIHPKSVSIDALLDWSTLRDASQFQIREMHQLCCDWYKFLSSSVAADVVGCGFESIVEQFSLDVPTPQIHDWWSSRSQDTNIPSSTSQPRRQWRGENQSWHESVETCKKRSFHVAIEFSLQTRNKLLLLFCPRTRVSSPATHCLANCTAWPPSPSQRV